VQELGSAVGCVTIRRLDVTPDAGAADVDLTAFFPAPMSLRAPAGGPSGLFLDVKHVFALIESERDRLRSRWQVNA
jgi:hypothetical protein